MKRFRKDFIGMLAVLALTYLFVLIIPKKVTSQRQASTLTMQQRWLVEHQIPAEAVVRHLLVEDKSLESLELPEQLKNYNISVSDHEDYVVFVGVDGRVSYAYFLEGLGMNGDWQQIDRNNTNWFFSFD